MLWNKTAVMKNCNFCASRPFCDLLEGRHALHSLHIISVRRCWYISLTRRQPPLSVCTELLVFVKIQHHCVVFNNTFACFKCVWCSVVLSKKRLLKMTLYTISSGNWRYEESLEKNWVSGRMQLNWNYIPSRLHIKVSVGLFREWCRGANKQIFQMSKLV